MKITLTGASTEQNEIAQAYAQRSTFDFDIALDVKAVRLMTRESFALKASRDGQKVTATIATAIDHPLRYALNALEKWLLESACDEISLEDGPDFPIRGVIEGFYGKPWTHEQRLKGLPLFGDFGMNAYFIAPKDVPWQRFNWRAPFESNFIASIQELVILGKKHAVDVVVCVSPGLSVKYCDENDVAAVVHRFKQLFAIGISHFSLLWDDIAWELQHPQDIEKYATTAEAQAEFTNNVFTELLELDPLVKMTLCPMQYSGRGEAPYLEDLGRALNPRIEIMWTGRQICSEYLDISDAVVFNRSALRPPLYWDNFPVNDGGMQTNLYIGPLRGREAGLHKYSTGLLSNPMLQFEASMIPVATIGDYLWSSTSYNPEQSWERALVKLIPVEADRIALRAFLRTSLASNVGGDPAPDLRKVFYKGVTAWRAGTPAKAGEIFESEGKEIIAHHSHLTSGKFSQPELIEEIKEWLEKYLLGGEVLCGLGEVLKTCGFDKVKNVIQGTATSAQELTALRNKLGAHHKKLFGDQIEGPINELIAELQS